MEITDSLYEVGNIDEFLDRLNVLAENSELRIKFSKSAKNRAKDFTEEKYSTCGINI